MMKLLTGFKIVALLVVLGGLMFGILSVRSAFVDRADQVADLQEKLHELNAAMDVVNAETVSQRKLLADVRSQNTDLADALKSSGVKVKRLRKLVLSYEKELADIKARPAQLVEGVSRVSFTHDFKTAHLSGWFEARQIVEPQQWHFELEPKAETVMIADTTAGSVPMSDQTEQIDLKVSDARAGFFDRVGYFTGVEVGANGVPGVVGGISFDSWNVYGRIGSDPAIGFFKRWDLRRGK